MTQAYIGTKIVGAWPAEKDGREGYSVVYPDGYTSWCPKDTFEHAYRAVTHDEAGIIEAYGVDS